MVEPAGLDLARALEQPQHRAGDAASDQHREHEAEHGGNAGHDGRNDDRLVLLANDGGGAATHLRQHVGADGVDLAAELLAQRIGLGERPLRAIEIARVELLQQQLILFVETTMQIVDRGVDAVVETAERGIVRRRRGDRR